MPEAEETVACLAGCSPHTLMGQIPKTWWRDRNDKPASTSTWKDAGTTPSDWKSIIRATEVPSADCLHRRKGTKEIYFPCVQEIITWSKRYPPFLRAITREESLIGWLASERVEPKPGGTPPARHLSGDMYDTEDNFDTLSFPCKVSSHWNWILPFNKPYFTGNYIRFRSSDEKFNEN